MNRTSQTGQQVARWPRPYDLLLFGLGGPLAGAAFLGAVTGGMMFGFPTPVFLMLGFLTGLVPAFLCGAAMRWLAGGEKPLLSKPWQVIAASPFIGALCSFAAVPAGIAVSWFYLGVHNNEAGLVFLILFCSSIAGAGASFFCTLALEACIAIGRAAGQPATPKAIS